MSVKAEKRTIQTEAEMEQYFKELIPHLKAIEELMAKYDGEKTVDIVVSSDGYVRAGVYNTGYELSKYKSDPYKIRREYTFTEVMEEVS